MHRLNRPLAQLMIVAILLIMTSARGAEEAPPSAANLEKLPADQLEEAVYARLDALNRDVRLMIERLEQEKDPTARAAIIYYLGETRASRAAEPLVMHLKFIPPTYADDLGLGPR